MRVTALLFSLAVLATAKWVPEIPHHKPNKPGGFEYLCAHDDCDYEKVALWIRTTCGHIGGKRIVDNVTLWGRDGQVVGGSGVCLCVDGDIQPYLYHPTKWYPPGKIRLSFGVEATYGCESNGKTKKGH